MKDLIADVRFSNRQLQTGALCGNSREDIENYRNRCLEQAKELFVNRHNVKMDRNGWPKLPSFFIKFHYWTKS